MSDLMFYCSLVVARHSLVVRPVSTQTGTQLRYSLTRWGSLGFPRFFMSEPALAVEYNRRNNSTSSDGSGSSGSRSRASGSSGLSGNSRRYGLRVEGSLPAAAAAKAAVIWQGLGLQDLNAAAAAAGNSEGGYCIEAAGTVSTTLEFLLLPRAFVKSLHDMFGLLPHAVWAVGPGHVWSTLSGIFGVRKCGKKA